MLITSLPRSYLALWRGKYMRQAPFFDPCSRYNNSNHRKNTPEIGYKGTETELAVYNQIPYTEDIRGACVPFHCRFTPYHADSLLHGSAEMGQLSAIITDFIHTVFT